MSAQCIGQRGIAEVEDVARSAVIPRSG